MSDRCAEIRRTTGETEIELSLALDGGGEGRIETGVAFLDHLLDSWTRHSRANLVLICRGDLQVDDHHTVEDCAICLGRALDQALGDRSRIARFGWAMAPLDEAVSRSVLDLVARPHAGVELGLVRDRLGTLSTENVTHFLDSFAMAGQFCLHVDVIKGKNDHHRAESAFKSLALACRQAWASEIDPRIASTKGTLK